MLRLTLVLFLALTASPMAFSQTACPSGVAPGSPQCGSDAGTSRADSAPPRPTGRWIKTWGALAINPGGDLGTAMGRFTKEDAENLAVRRCEEFNEGRCEVVTTIYNQCIAVAMTPAGKTGIVTGGSKEAATAAAMQKCERDSGQSCKPLLANCSDSIFERF